MILMAWWVGIYQVEYCLSGNYIRWSFLDWNNPDGNFMGGNYRRWKFSGWKFPGWVLSWVGIFSVDIVWVLVIVGGNFPGGNCPGESHPGWKFSLVGIFWVEFDLWELSVWQYFGWEHSCYHRDVILNRSSNS